MTYAVTPALGLKKPEYDFSVNTWGFELNDSLDILDAAVSKSGGIGVNLFKYSAAGIAPPDSGEIRFNNVNLTLATTMWVSLTASNGSLVSSSLLASIKTGSSIYLQNLDNPSNWVHYQAMSDGSSTATHVTWTVKYIGSGGSLLAGSTYLNGMPGGYISNNKADLWFGAISGTPNKWSWNDKADGSGNEIARLEDDGDFWVKKDFEADGKVTVGGVIVAGGSVTSGQNFVSASANVVLANTGSGIIYLRPKGAADTTNQTSINANGDMNVQGNIVAAGSVTANQNFDSTSTTCILSASSGGAIYFRPNGPTSATEEMLLSSVGDLIIKGEFEIHSSMVNTKGVRAGKGILERLGSTGSYGTQYINFLWTGTELRIYADGTYVAKATTV